MSKTNFRAVALLGLITLLTSLNGFASKRVLPTNIKVLTYNIRVDADRWSYKKWSFRRDRVAALIKKSKSDLIGLQEVSPGQLRDLKRRLLEYEFFGHGRKSNLKGEHCPILFDQKILEFVRSKAC